MQRAVPVTLRRIGLLTAPQCRWCDSQAPTRPRQQHSCGSHRSPWMSEVKRDDLIDFMVGRDVLLVAADGDRSLEFVAVLHDAVQQPDGLFEAHVVVRPSIRRCVAGVRLFVNQRVLYDAQVARNRAGNAPTPAERARGALGLAPRW